MVVFGRLESLAIKNFHPSVAKGPLLTVMEFAITIGMGRI